jgi:hypothetical protein
MHVFAAKNRGYVDSIAIFCYNQEVLQLFPAMCPHKFNRLSNCGVFMRSRLSVLLTTLSFAVLAATLGGCSNPAAQDDPLSTSQPDDQTVDITFNTDDFIDMPLPASGLAKVEAPYGTSYKWGYRNILVPQQSGKLLWYLDIRCKDGIDERAIIRAAFNAWQPYLPFAIEETNSAAKANIVFRFLTGESYITGPGTTAKWYTSGTSMTLAVAFRPVKTWQGLGFDYWGDVQINNSQISWTAGAGSTIYCPWVGRTVSSSANLINVLTHELGHSLGLDHDKSSLSIMYPTVSAKATLYDSDINGITQLYNMPYQMVYSNDYAGKVITASMQDLLGRKPTSAELTAYRNKLAFNRLPSKMNYDYRQLLGEIGGSSAAWTRAKKTNKTFVANTIAGLLGRTATESEKNYYDAKIKAGWTQRIVVDSIVKLDEWATRYVTLAYKAHLGRAPTTNERTAMVTALRTRQIEPFAVVWGCTKSEEYYKLSSPQTAVGFVNRIYTTLLNSTPTATVRNNWVAWVN